MKPWMKVAAIATLGLVGWLSWGPSSDQSSTQPDDTQRISRRASAPARAARHSAPRSSRGASSRPATVPHQSDTPALGETDNEVDSDPVAAGAAPTKAAFEQAFSESSSDSEWSRDALPRAEEVMTAALPEGSSVASIACRSSVCRVEISHAESGAHQAFAHSLMSGGEGWDGPGTMIRMQGDDGSETTLAYLGPAHAEDDPNSVWAGPVAR